MSNSPRFFFEVMSASSRFCSRSALYCAAALSILARLAAAFSEFPVFLFFRLIEPLLVIVPFCRRPLTPPLELNLRVLLVALAMISNCYCYCYCYCHCHVPFVLEDRRLCESKRFFVYPKKSPVDSVDFSVDILRKSKIPRCLRFTCGRQYYWQDETLHKIETFSSRRKYHRCCCCPNYKSKSSSMDLFHTLFVRRSTRRTMQPTRRYEPVFPD
mmetsp:Transcript_14591/g.36670  ORF Transcript_14591/g.36670 Transcript_14591/m.36670 type:complete len:214 (+) Transcript_14591:2269-2910(+)